MLVKLLSFTASVIGTARYKAVFLSCFVLALSVAGVAGMALWHGSGSRSTASTLEKTGTEGDTQQGSPQLGNNRKRTIQNEGSIDQQANPQPNGSAQTTPAPKPAAGTGTTVKVLEITLNKADITLIPGETSEIIKASVPEDRNVEWVITVDSGFGLSIVNQEQTGTTIQFQIHKSAEQNTTQTGPYKAILQAKDTTQSSVVTSKNITINIL